MPRLFPGAPVVKNPPLNAGDKSSIPDQGTKIPHARGQLYLLTSTRESPHTPTKTQHSPPKKPKKDPKKQKSIPKRRFGEDSRGWVWCMEWRQLMRAVALPRRPSDVSFGVSCLSHDLLVWLDCSGALLGDTEGGLVGDSEEEQEVCMKRLGEKGRALHETCICSPRAGVPGLSDLVPDDLRCVQACPVAYVVANSLGPHGLCGPPGSSVHGILQARILESVSIPFSNRLSQPRDPTQVSCTAG